MKERIGIIGVGHIVGYLVAGWRRADPHLPIALSPRNAERSAALAAQWGCTIGADNQDVVDLSSVVLLATRPAGTVAAAQTLRFRPDQLVISVAATLPLAAVADAVAPATAARSLPLSCASLGMSPTLLYPDSSRARVVLEPLGDVLALSDEDQFATAVTISAYYVWIHALLGEGVAWAAGAGVPAEIATRLVLETARGAASMLLAAPERPISDTLRSLATPGGISEQGLAILQQHDAFGPWIEALDAVRSRLIGHPGDPGGGSGVDGRQAR